MTAMTAPIGNSLPSFISFLWKGTCIYYVIEKQSFFWVAYLFNSCQVKYKLDRKGVGGSFKNVCTFCDDVIYASSQSQCELLAFETNFEE